MNTVKFVRFLSAAQNIHRGLPLNNKKITNLKILGGSTEILLEKSEVLSHYILTPDTLYIPIDALKKFASTVKNVSNALASTLVNLILDHPYIAVMVTTSCAIVAVSGILYYVRIGLTDNEITVENVENAQEDFNCPINGVVFTDPVIIPICGHCFNRDAINDWFKKQLSCPICQNNLPSNDVIPNLQLRSQLAHMEFHLDPLV
uniref:U-box domain protein n=1 Tax=Marseillevirus LCMAC101 TaxID=2506602 RepID=A0A481YR53_9VIRU|nr:MAG: U-box domain protein [Marseillevirus LCMAC101]